MTTHRSIHELRRSLRAAGRGLAAPLGEEATDVATVSFGRRLKFALSHVMFLNHSSYCG